MNYRKLSMILALAAAITACKSRQQASSISSSAAPGLTVRLSVASKPNKDSVILAFTVRNAADTVQHFLKWETPFEPLLGKYLSATSKNGTEARYKGPMAKRMMPPPADSYMAVSPHDSIRTTFDLLKGYEVTRGTYTVKYIASGISGLKPENELRITVPSK